MSEFKSMIIQEVHMRRSDLCPDESLLGHTFSAEICMDLQALFNTEFVFENYDNDTIDERVANVVHSFARFLPDSPEKTVGAGHDTFGHAMNDTVTTIFNIDPEANLRLVGSEVIDIRRYKTNAQLQQPGGVLYSKFLNSAQLGEILAQMAAARNADNAVAFKWQVGDSFKITLNIYDADNKSNVHDIMHTMTLTVKHDATVPLECNAYTLANGTQLDFASFMEDFQTTELHWVACNLEAVRLDQLSQTRYEAGVVPGEMEKVALEQGDFANGTVVISQPGTYCLAEDIAFAYPDWASAAILIDANSVLLDLNGHSLAQTTADQKLNRFFSLVRIAANREDVIVRNGTLGNSAEYGVQCRNARNVFCHDLTCTGFERAGIYIQDCKNCIVQSCSLIGASESPVSFNYTRSRHLQYDLKDSDHGLDFGSNSGGGAAKYYAQYGVLCDNVTNMYQSGVTVEEIHGSYKNSIFQAVYDGKAIYGPSGEPVFINQTVAGIYRGNIQTDAALYAAENNIGQAFAPQEIIDWAQDSLNNPLDSDKLVRSEIGYDNRANSGGYGIRFLNCRGFYLDSSAVDKVNGTDRVNGSENAGTGVAIEADCTGGRLKDVSVTDYANVAYETRGATHTHTWEGAEDTTYSQ